MSFRVKSFNCWTVGLFVIICVHLYLLSRLIFFPYPELFVYSYLTSRGLLPYAQILDQHFPGLMFFPLNLYTLGMKTLKIARYWHFGVVGLTQIFLFLTSRKLFKSEKLALLTNFLYLIWQPYFEGYVLWIDSFIPLFLLPAIYFLIGTEDEKRARNLFLLGLFLGLSLVFKQTTGPLIILLGVYLLSKLRSVKRTLPLAVGVLAPFSLMLLYFYSAGVWNDFFYWTITYNLTTFAKMGRKLPELGPLVRSVPVFGFSLFVLILVWLKKRSAEVVLLLIFLVGSLFFAYARFDYIHLQPALPFAVIGTLYFFRMYLKNAKQWFVAMFLLVVVANYLLSPFYKMNRQGESKFFGDFERRLSAEVLEYADAGDSVFTMGTTPHLYYLTNTLPPGNIFVFQFPWFMIEAEHRILDGIISGPPKVVVRDKTASTSGMNLVLYMQNINNYVEENYETVDFVDNAEIMIPR